MNPAMDEKRIERLLAEYGLRTPVPADYRSYILARKPRLYRRILKSAGRLTLFGAVGASIYFLFKRIIAGITITKIVLTILTMVSFSLGGYLAVRYIYPPHIAGDDAPAIHRSGSDERHLRAIIKTGDKAAFEYQIAIRPLSGRSDDTAVRLRATEYILHEMASLRGKGFARISLGGDGSRYVLVGSVESAGGTMALLVKVVEVETSEIVFAAQEKLKSPEELADACVRITRRIASRVE